MRVRSQGVRQNLGIAPVVLGACHRVAVAEAIKLLGIDGVHAMLVRVALANKMARIVWALLTRGEVYRAPAVGA
jgi:hypothetical protein